MKPTSPELRALLASRQFYTADLYHIVLNQGGELRYSAGDIDITANGILYPATGVYGSGTIGGPYFDRTDNKAKIHQKVGLEVDTLTLDVIPGASVIFGQPFLAACDQGLFDGAKITMYRAFMPTYGNTAVGVVIIFSGIVAEIDAGRSVATFTVNSSLELLNENFPHNMFQPGCINNLGDDSCRVDLSLLSSSLTVVSATAAVITANVTNALVGYYDLGKVTFTSGTLNGFTRTIKTCTFGSPGTIALYGPLPSAPLVGDNFLIYPGCDKSRGVNGCPKFANLIHFRGFPFIPQPSTSV